MKPIVRCSGLDDLFRCHGSRLLRAKVKELPSKVAMAGTWCHWEAAVRLMREFGDVHADSTDSDTLAKPHFADAFKPTWFDLWIVDYYLSVIRDTTDVDMMGEVEVELTAEFDRFILSGHLDRFAINAAGTHAKGWDLKRGAIAVDPADENNQVLGYIILLFLAYDTLQEVEFFIVQPSNDPELGWPRVSSVTVRREELDKHVAFLNAEVCKALDNPMELDSGPKQCRHCNASVQCPARKKEEDHVKHLMTSGEFEAILAEPDNDRLMETYISLKTLDAALAKADEQVRDRVNRAGGALAFGANRRAYFTARNGARKCKDTRQAFQRLQAVCGENAVDACEVKAGLAEETLAKTLGLSKSSKVVGKATGQTEFKSRLGDLFEQSVNQVLVVE